jgi:limonene-1,2-epoxide hydrolase
VTMLKRKRAGLGDAMSVVTRFVNACNRHDADGVYACLHPDFDSIQPMYPSRNFRGADQVRRNWQAIFDAEPGFRLTVLRSAATDDTVWLELHGAGRDAEVAGVFVMGVQGDRIRWARIYSALVEPVPAAADGGTASTSTGGAPPRQEVPRPGPTQAAGNGEVVEEALIAPVVDIERSGRRRRRSSRRELEPETAAVEPEAPAAAQPEAEPPAAADAAEPEPEVEAVVVVEPAADVVEPEVLVDPAREAQPQVEPQPEPEVVAVIVADEAPADPVPEVVAEPEAPEPEATTPRPEEPGRRRFGKKTR